MKIIAVLIFLATACFGQPDTRLKCVVHSENPVVDISRLFDAYNWQIQISDPHVKRIDLKFFFQEKTIIETWLIDESKDLERLLDIAIGPLRDIGFGDKWRVYAGIHGRSAWWCSTVDIPLSARGRMVSLSGGPVLQDDGTFGLVFVRFDTDKGGLDVPLKVSIRLSTSKEKEPKQALEPTTPVVTPRAPSIASHASRGPG